MHHKRKWFIHLQSQQWERWARGLVSFTFTSVCILNSGRGNRGSVVKAIGWLGDQLGLPPIRVWLATSVLKMFGRCSVKSPFDNVWMCEYTTINGLLIDLCDFFMSCYMQCAFIEWHKNAEPLVALSQKRAWYFTRLCHYVQNAAWLLTLVTVVKVLKIGEQLLKFRAKIQV